MGQYSFTTVLALGFNLVGAFFRLKSIQHGLEFYFRFSPKINQLRWSGEVIFNEESLAAVWILAIHNSDCGLLNNLISQGSCCSNFFINTVI